MSGPFDAEIKKYTEALAADPKSRVFVPLSDVYRKLGRYDEAILVAKEGLTHHPHYMGGKMALARAYFENGDLDLAEELLEEILNFAADNLLANRLLAQIFLVNKGKERALPLLKQLLALDPGDSWAIQQLAKVSVVPVPPVAPIPTPSPVVAKPEPAISKPAPVVSKSEPIAPEPVPPTQTATLAELYRAQGHPDQALEIYRHLLGSDPRNVSFLRAVKDLEQGAKPTEKSPEPTVSRKGALLEQLLARIRERRRKAA